jgi:hypothetical protein
MNNYTNFTTNAPTNDRAHGRSYYNIDQTLTHKMDVHYNNLKKKLNRLLNKQHRKNPTTTIYATASTTNSIPEP